MSSSEYSSEDDKILEAIDTSFLTENLYQKMEKSKGSALSTHTSVNINQEPKSQRYLNDEEPDINYINIPETLQIFAAKKLSNVIAKQNEFVEIVYDGKNINDQSKGAECLKLLKESEAVITLEINKIVNPTVKPIIKKRKFEFDPDDILTEKEKLKLVSIDPEDIINQVNMEHWKDRRKSKVFHYEKKSDCTYQYVEQENEFSALRKKNNWSYDKIARQNTKTNSFR